MWRGGDGARPNTGAWAREGRGRRQRATWQINKDEGRLALHFGGGGAVKVAASNGAVGVVVQQEEEEGVVVVRKA